MKKKIFSMLLMGACLLASVSLFTSCKDYDDEIAANKTEIATLRAELTTVKSNLEASLNTERSSFETQIAAMKAQLQSAIDQKADEETVKGLEANLKQLQEDYASRMAVLTSQVEAAYDAIAKLDEKADKSTVDGVVADLAALTGKLEDETKAREAVEANLRIQLQALETFMKEFKDANLQDQIDNLKKAIGEIQTNVEVSAMKVQMNNLEQLIVNVNSNLSALEVLVERMLNSISLVPQLYIRGIEAIEFTSLKYNEFLPKDDKKPTGSSNLVSTGETTATYRLNPTTVRRDGIDEKNIEFLAATAETRAVSVKSPVAFNGIKGDINNGLMTVKIKKVTNDYLGDDNTNPITIVALKVPRNPELYEAADIISENSRLVENFYFPRIAATAQEGSTKALKNADWTGTDTYYDNVDMPNGSGRTVDLIRPCHYTDSTTILASRVDENPLQLVSKVIYYRDSYDLKKIVTGCKYDGDYVNPTCEATITPEELKEYGMVFRFNMMQRDYHNNAPHNSNQQEFAKVTPDGIISSCIPGGVTDNKACIGKEPIVRVELIDTVQHKVVDRRYLKIKWTDKQDPTDPEPPQPEALHLFDKEQTLTMDWCSGVVPDGIIWREFITKAYAVIEHHSELAGISEQMFREIYWDKPREITVSWTTNWPSNYASLTSAPNAGSSSAKPYVSDSPNLHGDAIVAGWDLGADKVKTVYCSSFDDTKTFTAKVLFKSNDKRYPDVYFNWIVKIELPKNAPSITGFYDQYWLSNKHEAHDILPLQFNSTLQRWWDANGKSYCFYDNDLMNAFVYENNKIVKGIPSCGSWDIQFDGSYGPYPTSDLYETGEDPGQHNRISMSGGKKVDTRNFYNPSYLTLSLIPWRNFDGYKKGSLQMMWLSDNYAVNNNYNNHNVDNQHKAWDNNPLYKNAYLRADKPVASLLGYLNPLDDDPSHDIVGPDGTKQPLRTHTKPLDFNIWCAMNPWNYIPVLSYKAYMVAPLRVNWKTSDGIWQDGEVAGSPVPWRGLLTLTDFRGYLVQDVPNGTVSSTDEQLMWTEDLWRYYECQRPSFNCAGAKFSFKKTTAGNVEVDNTIDPRNGMTSSDLKNWTNGNIVISFSDNNGTSDYIYFYNNGGSNIEEKVRVWIPVEINYGWGTISSGMYGWVYPHGEKPAN